MRLEVNPKDKQLHRVTSLHMVCESSSLSHIYGYIDRERNYIHVNIYEMCMYQQTLRAGVARREYTVDSATLRCQQRHHRPTAGGRCAFCFNRGHVALDCRKRQAQLTNIPLPRAQQETAQQHRALVHTPQTSSSSTVQQAESKENVPLPHDDANFFTLSVLKTDDTFSMYHDTEKSCHGRSFFPVMAGVFFLS